MTAIAVVATSHASRASAGSFPWAPTAALSKPSIGPDEVSPAGGLGNTRQDLERSYGAPSGLLGTMVGYKGGAYAASYNQNRAVHLLVNFGGVTNAGLDGAR